MMNKKGQLIFLGIMIAVMVFIVGIVLITPIKEAIGIARNASNLDCSNASIGTGQSMTCILTDWYMPYFIGAVWGVGLGFIGMKMYNSQQ